MASAVWLFLRARYAGWAALVGTAGALGLAGASGVVEAPVTGEAVSLPYVWPAASVVPVVLVARSRLADWERRGTRRLAAAHAAVLVGVPAIGAVLVLALQPRAWPALITTALVLQALAVLGFGLLGEWMWLPVAAAASLTVLRSSAVQALLAYCSSGDHPVPALAVAAAAYGLVVGWVSRLASPRPWTRSSGWAIWSRRAPGRTLDDDQRPLGCRAPVPDGSATEGPT
jgi:hypothetical protein